jgi:hypothetical protein
VGTETVGVVTVGNGSDGVVTVTPGVVAVATGVDTVTRGVVTVCDPTVDGVTGLPPVPVPD